MELLVGFCERNGCPQQFWFGTICVLFVGTAEDMQAVLTSPNCLQKSYVYDFFMNKNGLFTAPGLSFIYFFKFYNNLIDFVCLFSTFMERISKIAKSNI